MIVYKIVIVTPFGNYKTLFHGIDRSKKLPLDKWLEADKKLVRDGSGGRLYMSGIHCFNTKEIGEDYMKKFDREDLILIKCEARGLRYKPTNHNVLLADGIYISSQICPINANVAIYLTKRGRAPHVV